MHERVLPVVRDGLVEGGVLLGGHVVAVALPYGLRRVQGGPLLHIDHLRFLRRRVLDLLDVPLLLFDFVLVLVLDGLLCASEELHRVPQEAGMLTHDLLEGGLLQVLERGVLESELHARTTGRHLVVGHGFDLEAARGGAAPLVGNAVGFVLASEHVHFLCDQIGGVEADSELPDQILQTTSVPTPVRHGHGEVLGTGAGDRAQVVH